MEKFGTALSEKITDDSLASVESIFSVWVLLTAGRRNRIQNLLEMRVFKSYLGLYAS